LIDAQAICIGYLRNAAPDIGSGIKPAPGLSIGLPATLIYR
jgi:hypothetical protein